MPNNKRILVVDENPLNRESLKDLLEQKKYVPCGVKSVSKALKVIDDNDIAPHLIILDLDVPKSADLISSVQETGKNIPIIVMTRYDKIDNVSSALKTGACDHLKKPVNSEELFLRIERALDEAGLKKEVTRPKTTQHKKTDVSIIVGVSHVLKNVLNMIEKIARSDAKTVLIEGESGTGKELIAKSIHNYSRRSDKPFVIVNCAAIPETLLETELMGYEKGAYTDAKKDKIGLLELANEGTLFLDEVGEMGIGMQAKFLRIIEDKTFRRVGGTKNIHVDIRIIAATNAKLKQRIENGNFRADLYYRLLVVPIYLPPLRERNEDILILADYFINKYNREFNKNVKGLSSKAKKILESYLWPGNVRELKNVIERALILEDKDEILPEHLPYELTMEAEGRNIKIEKKFTLPPEGLSIEEVEKSLVKQALVATNGKQVAAAKLLGLTRDALRRRAKKYDFK